MTGQGRLPVVFPPEADERLSCWITRLASFYAIKVPESLTDLGLPDRDARSGIIRSAVPITSGQ